MIDVRCGQCGESFSVPGSLAGQAETCPSCRALVKVPVPGKLPRPPAAGLPPTRAQGPTLAAWIGVAAIYAAGFLMCLIGANSRRYDNLLVAGMITVFGVTVFLIGCLPGLIAMRKNLPNAHDIHTMGILGIFLLGVFWVVALCLALAGTPRPAGMSTSEGAASPPVATDRMACPMCGESIPRVAKICRFCRHQLTA